MKALFLALALSLVVPVSAQNIWPEQFGAPVTVINLDHPFQVNGYLDPAWCTEPCIPVLVDITVTYEYQELNPDGVLVTKQEIKKLANFGDTTSFAKKGDGYHKIFLSFMYQCIDPNTGKPCNEGEIFEYCCPDPIPVVPDS